MISSLTAPEFISVPSEYEGTTEEVSQCVFLIIPVKPDAHVFTIPPFGLSNPAAEHFRPLISENQI